MHLASQLNAEQNISDTKETHGLIDVNALTKNYGDFTAVQQISFTAEPGQVTGFLGPNGAGKTTTMRMLTGYMPPTSGKATVAGYDVFDNSMAVRQRVGYLPETVPLYRDMSAREYLMYIAEIRGLKQRRAKADDVLTRVGLKERAGSRIRALSKGMRQRVGLAAALIHDPEVLILDEPTIGLDPIQVLELRDLVRDLGQDHTVLFSTHILSEAEQVCDKVVIINRGQVIAQGAPADLRRDLERGGRVLVRVAAKEDDALQTIAALPLVAEVTRDVNGLVATPADPQTDPRPAIAQALVTGGFDIVEIRSLAVSLEDIFLELTQTQGAAATETTQPETQATTGGNDA